MNLKALELKIEMAYLEGVSLTEAEKLAAEFLSAQLQVSDQLKVADLDAKMRKSGLKAVRAAVYLDKRNGPDKLTEATLAAMVDTDKDVGAEQEALDVAEVERDALERYYNIFSNAHVFFRGVAKGSFGG